MSKPLDPKVKAVNTAQKNLDAVNKKIAANKEAGAKLVAEKVNATTALKAAKDAAKAAPKK